jgi:hypothetical protein
MRALSVRPDVRQSSGQSVLSDVPGAVMSVGSDEKVRTEDAKDAII